MKRAIAIAALLIGGAIPAQADVYVAVDAQGNAVSGAIMCDAATCAEGSQYSRLTLQPGQRYVLQGTGQSGIGNNNPNTEVKVDLQTNDWSVTRTTRNQEDKEVVSVQTFNPYKPEPTPRIETTTMISETATAWLDSQTVLSDTATAIAADYDWSAFFEMFKNWFMNWFIGWWKP